MPREWSAVERRLKRSARKRGLRPGSKRYNAYVYGTMRRLGWQPRRKKRSSGR